MPRGSLLTLPALDGAIPNRRLMAQVTQDMAERIIQAADKYERYPLTVWELRQLAHAWLKLNAPESQILNRVPFAPKTK